VLASAAEGDMEFRILGPLEVRAHGRSLRLGGPKQRALLAVLLLHAGEVVPRERLIDQLWGESPPKTASDVLRVLVSKLRKALGAGAVRTRPPGYVLQVDPDEIDSAQFQRLLDEGAQLLGDGDAERAAAVLDDALSLWRGPPLTDFTYEPFAQDEIRRLEELRLAALEHKIDAELRLDGSAALVGELEALVAEHPYRERFREQQILALYRAGRQAEALAAYQDLRRVLRDDLGIEPSPLMRRLERQVLLQDVALDSAALAGRAPIPVPATRLIGRQAEVAEIRTLLRAPGVQLVTLTGAGGSGKTRLATEIGTALAREFRDGAAFVDLAPLEEPGFVPLTIARALGARERVGEPIGVSLRRFLAARQLLLLLDNFEHLLEASGELARLISGCPRLSVLVTSRAPLRIHAEHEMPIQPLAEDDAISLFIERARAVNPHLQLNDPDVPAVREICARLDSLPLAVELAAARTNVLHPQALLARLEPRLPLLIAGTRDAPARHRTLQATIDWSYGLLDDDEKELFARLSVFTGACTLAAATEVCEGSLDRLAPLVDGSLLRAEPDFEGQLRFSMFETTREYALERLEHSGEAAALFRRHAEYCLAFVEEARQHLDGLDARDWIQRLEADGSNLHAALSWAERAGETAPLLELGGALAAFWMMRGYRRDAERWLHRAIDRGGGDGDRPVESLCEAASLAYQLGEIESARELAAGCIAEFRARRDASGIARCLLVQAPVAVADGDYARAEALLIDAARFAREASDEALIARTTVRLGQVALYRGEHQRADDLLQAGFQAFGDLGRGWEAAWALKQIGLLSLDRGNGARASELIRESLRRLLEAGWIGGVIVDGGLEALAALAALDGQTRRAMRLLGAASSSRQHGGASLVIPFEHSWHERTVALIRDQHPTEEVRAAFEEGRAMNVEQALRYATAEVGGATPLSPGRRERRGAEAPRVAPVVRES
jgi:predicted ATPase/DNA-binding SARP family transcriptional activator